MAKGLPYFKFNSSEYLTGDICIESFEIQGIFTNICAVYWQRDGKIKFDDLKKRYKNHLELLDQLVGIFIHVDGDDDSVSINFLDEQLVERNHASQAASENGKKGAEVKKARSQTEATLKPPLSDPLANKKKNKNKEKELESEKELEKKKEEIPPLPPMGDDDSKKNIVEVFDLKAEQKKEPLPGPEKIKPVVINLRDSSFSNEFTEKIWESWKEFRRQKRKPISGALEEKTAMKQLWAMCGGDERTAAQIINQSISNGWQGLFELKDITRTSNNQQNLSNKTKGQIAFERMNEKLEKAGII